MQSLALSIDHLAAGYGDMTVVFDATFNVQSGEAIAISASNGAGKSTLLAAISGVLRPTMGGAVRFRGQEIQTLPSHRVCRLGLVHVLERRRLAPFMSVLDNLRLSATSVPRSARRAWQARFDQFRREFTLLETHGGRLASELSGGQQQVVAILRGLLASPEVLLLDEPFQGLDGGAMAEVSELLDRARRAGTTLIFTEHRDEIVDSLATRVLYLDHGRIRGA